MEELETVGEGMGVGSQKRGVLGWGFSISEVGLDGADVRSLRDLPLGGCFESTSKTMNAVAVARDWYWAKSGACRRVCRFF